MFCRALPKKNEDNLFLWNYFYANITLNET